MNCLNGSNFGPTYYLKHLGSGMNRLNSSNDIAEASRLRNEMFLRHAKGSDRSVSVLGGLSTSNTPGTDTCGVGTGPVPCYTNTLFKATIEHGRINRFYVSLFPPSRPDMHSRCLS